MTRRIFWSALVSAIMVAVGVVVLFPHKPKPDDGKALAQVLNRLRRGIALYRDNHSDHGPARLEDLVTDGDLPAVPIDPITNAKDWQLMTEESVNVNDFRSGTQNSATPPGIIDVHSNAKGKDPTGRLFSDY